MPSERDNDGELPGRTGAGWSTPTRLFVRTAGLRDVVDARATDEIEGSCPFAQFEGIAHRRQRE